MNLSPKLSFYHLRSERGFSLLEMMAVLSIVSIIAFMAIPNFKMQSQKGLLKEDALAVREALTRARSLALSRQECVLVKINSDTQILTTSHAPVSGNNCFGSLANPSFTASPTEIKGPGKIGLFNGTKNEIVFNSMGGLTETNLVTVQITDETQKFEIVVYPAIGQIRMR